MPVRAKRTTPDLRGVLLLATAMLMACGPSTNDAPSWLLGTFSLPRAGLVDQTYVERYVIDSDNRVEVFTEATCEAEPREETLEWEYRGDDIWFFLPEDAEDRETATISEWRVRETEECNVLELQPYLQSSGNPLRPQDLVRGAVCTHRLEPCPPPGGQCPWCETVWCDEPPSACEDP